MDFQVLIAAMNETSLRIIQESNIKSPALIINQCNNDGYEEVDDTIILSCRERGLSKSRNKAIENAEGEICLIADDDEYFIDGLQETVLKAYAELPDADIIVFGVSSKKNMYDRPRRIKKWHLLKVSSVQISFKLNSVKNKVAFDEKLGAGTGNGAGEENKFLLDCYKKGLKIYFYPMIILRLREKESTWFGGYNEEFFYKRGMATRYVLGWWLSVFYAFYYVITHKKQYRKTISVRKALKATLKGIKENKLNELS